MGMAPNEDTILVAVVDESELVVEGVSAMLSSRIPRFEVTTNPIGADVALVDPTLPGRVGSVRDRVRLLTSQAELVALFSWKVSAVHDLLVREHRLAGALSKASDSDKLAQAITRLRQGEEIMMFTPGAMIERRLTPRETQCLQLLARGLTNREIGSHLNLSPETVKTVLSRSYSKIGVRNRAQAAAWAIRAGFADAA